MSAFERLWKDTMDVYQYDEDEENDVTINREMPVGTNIKCHYSVGSLADTGTDGVATLVNSHSLFCGLNTVKEGDKVIVTQHNTGTKITLTVGEGFPYGGGMQFSVKRDGTV